jgi:lipoprotein-anchoring transpeptidase ErfK/SrfK
MCALRSIEIFDTRSARMVTPALHVNNSQVFPQLRVNTALARRRYSILLSCIAHNDARNNMVGERKMSRVVRAAIGAALVAIALPMTAQAEVVVTVNRASQSMSVSVDGAHRYTWAVSTGVHGTPGGTFRPQALKRHHRSSIYNDAPMPYSIFYDGNFAIHGTTHVGRLGSRASKGCIRLHPSNAAVLYSLVQREGMGSTRIQIQ